jgi:ribonuclease P protein component
MLALKNRLKKKKDFDLVFKQGQIFKQGLFYFKVRPNKSKTSRFGFIVSKKFSKKAVERNRIKRMLREMIYPRTDKIKIPSDIIITVMPKAGEKELEKIIDKLFKKVNETFSKSN